MSLSVLIPFSSENERRAVLYEAIFLRWKNQFPDCEIVVGDSGIGPFSRSKSLNDAAKHATGDILAISDSDTICNRDFLHEAYELSKEEPWVLPYRVYYNLNERYSDEILPTVAKGRDFPRPELSDCEFAIPSVSGILFIRRELWIDFIEAFIGWGFEDNVQTLIFDTLIGRHQTIEGGWVAHLWHPAPETSRFGQPGIKHNRGILKQFERVAHDKEAMMDLIERYRRG